MNLEQIKERKLEIRGLLQGEEAIDLSALETELRELEMEQEDLEKRSKLLAMTEMAEAVVIEKKENRTIENVEVEKNMEIREDKFETMEYRQAFMDYMTKGEERAISGFGTEQAGKVIPVTISSKILEQLENFGEIYSRVSKSNIKGGLEVPISSLSATAHWVEEGSVAEKSKKGDIKATISFKYHKLQCRVPVTLEASVVSLPVFEQKIAQAIYKAMIVAIESSIFNGTGVKQPLGILSDTRVKDEQKIELTEADFTSFAGMAKVVAEISEEYDNGIVFVTNKKDYVGKILGMVDANGQPVAKITAGTDGKLNQKVFLGYPVLYAPVNCGIKSFDAASAGDVFGMFVNLADYNINSNMAMTVKRYIDEDTDEIITKSTLIADGKLIDTNSVLLLKKKVTRNK